MSSILGISKYYRTWVTSASCHFSKGFYFQVSLSVLLGVLGGQYFPSDWNIIYTFLRRNWYGLKKNSVTAEAGDISANIKSPNPATDISVAQQTLPEVITKPQKFNLPFCWVGHCPRARKSPWEGLLKVSLAGGYFPVVSELCGNCKNIVPLPVMDSCPVLGADYHWGVVMHSITGSVSTSGH